MRYGIQFETSSPALIRAFVMAHFDFYISSPQIARLGVNPMNNQYWIDSIIAVAILCFLYGLYFILYGTCMFILMKRKTPHYLQYATAATASFLLSTVGICISVALIVLGGIGRGELVAEDTDSHKVELESLRKTNLLV
ncbi:hypothetical protein PM082_024699 [Marasmius tenuissimus]|nr:hypothetical protein PM082_024699 [Marasmius tenuissimus]